MNSIHLKIKFIIKAEKANFLDSTLTYTTNNRIQFSIFSKPNSVNATVALYLNCTF